MEIRVVVGECVKEEKARKGGIYKWKGKVILRSARGNFDIIIDVKIIIIVMNDDG